MTTLVTTASTHLQELTQALGRFEEHVPTACRWGRELAFRLPAGARLIATGNGGSAAQAQHLTAELVGRYRRDRPPYSAICLSAETSTLTAIANDYPPEELFARQVEGHGRAGDVLLVLSTSGRSANAVAAAQRGRDCGLLTWALTGPGPNPLADVCDEVICVDASATSTVQELHLVALHLICEAFDAHLLDEVALQDTTAVAVTEVRR